MRLQYRRLLVRLAGHIVHDRLYDCVAFDGLAGRSSITARSCLPPAWVCGPLATVGSAFSLDYYHMFFWRSLLGVGEASYGVLTHATLLADLFPVKERGRAMGVYYLALARSGRRLRATHAGGDHHGCGTGWRAVFLVVGLPGLVAAFAGLVVKDPGRGAQDGGASVEKSARPGLKDYAELFRNRTFLYNTAGMAAVTFATGAYGAWGLLFYQRVHGLTAHQAGEYRSEVCSSLRVWSGSRHRDLRRRPCLQENKERRILLVAAFAVLCAIPLGAPASSIRITRHRSSTSSGASLLMSMVLGPSLTRSRRT